MRGGKAGPGGAAVAREGAEVKKREVMAILQGAGRVASDPRGARDGPEGAAASRWAIAVGRVGGAN